MPGFSIFNVIPFKIGLISHPFCVNSFFVFPAVPEVMLGAVDKGAVASIFMDGLAKHTQAIDFPDIPVGLIVLLRQRSGEMRPSGRGELESLYFEYPQFSAPPREGVGGHANVTVVGAGPVGMCAALTLAKRGQNVTLIDAKSTFNDGSRAICVARSSFALFQMLGVEQSFLDKALPWLSGRSFFRGKEILEFHMSDMPDEKFRPMYNIQQQFIERFLYEAIANEPLIDMRWCTECVGLDDDGEGVVLTLRDPEGTYHLESNWVIAADGARSPVRNMRGLRLKGENFEGRYVIADIQMENPVKVERFALFDPDCRPGATVLVHQQPSNIWRIDYQLREGENEEEELKESSIRENVSQVLYECGYYRPWDLEWWSIYSANTLALDDYRDGRVFFAGDSAHIVPIFGVRGFNNGVLDAHNLGWKLGFVLNGQADATLLDTYSPERRGATLDVFEKSSKSTQFMTPRTNGYRVMRDAALSLALDHPFAGQFANPRNMTPYSYTDSPLTRNDRQVEWAGAPSPGAFAPNVKLEDGFLLDLCGSNFTVLAFGNVPGLCDLPSDLTKCVALAGDGAVARTYGARDCDAVLLRPDQFIAARWHNAHGAEISREINRILCGGR